ncbi:MAG: hypothetical protein ACE5IZ_10815 [Dehalococcoidia bacterium]
MPTVRPEALDALYVDDLELVLCDISHIDPPPRSLTLAGQEYVFSRSYPVKGYSAVLGKAAREMMGEGKTLLVGRWGTRYYVYTAPA